MQRIVFICSCCGKVCTDPMELISKGQYYICNSEYECYGRFRQKYKNLVGDVAKKRFSELRK